MFKLVKAMNQIIDKCYSVILTVVIILVSNCKHEPVEVSASEPFASNLVGKWVWTKTVTPSGEITAQTSGSTKSMSYGNDSGPKGNYLYITETGHSSSILYQNNDFGQANSAEGTLTAQFDTKYIKFFLIKNIDNTYQELICTDLVDDYSKGYGEVRHYYKRAGAPEKP